MPDRIGGLRFGVQLQVFLESLAHGRGVVLLFVGLAQTQPRVGQPGVPLGGLLKPQRRGMELPLLEVEVADGQLLLGLHRVERVNLRLGVLGEVLFGGFPVFRFLGARWRRRLVLSPSQQHKNGQQHRRQERSCHN